MSGPARTARDDPAASCRNEKGIFGGAAASRVVVTVWLGRGTLALGRVRMPAAGPQDEDSLIALMACDLSHFFG
jgi:hypothetical protein